MGARLYVHKDGSVTVRSDEDELVLHLTGQAIVATRSDGTLVFDADGFHFYAHRSQEPEQHGPS